MHKKALFLRVNNCSSLRRETKIQCFGVDLLVSLRSKGILCVEAHWWHAHSHRRHTHVHGRHTHAHGRHTHVHWRHAHIHWGHSHTAYVRRRPDHECRGNDLVSRNEHVIVELLVSLLLFFLLAFLVLLLDGVDSRGEFLHDLDEVRHRELEEVEAPGELHREVGADQVVGSVQSHCDELLLVVQNEESQQVFD